MSDWINIDKIGSKGMEPDASVTHKTPQSLDIATNVRGLGPNLANAGGYAFVTDFPGPQVSQYVVEEVLVNRVGVRISQYSVGEIRQRPTGETRVSQFALLEVRESNEYTP